MRRPPSLLACLALLAAAPAAQLGDLLLCDTAGDQLVVLQDLDGDGRYLTTPYEVRRFFSIDGGVGTNVFSPRDAKLRVEGGETVAYWVDTVNDAIFRAASGDDFNGNGVIDLGEQTVWRNVGALDGSIGPRGIRPANDAGVWFTSSTSSLRGLFRLVDQNGDGTANGAGELAQVVDGLAPFTCQTDAGAVTVDPGADGHEFFTGLAPVGAGGMIAFAREHRAAFRVESGQIRLFLNPSAADPLLPQNPDFAPGGPLRSLAYDDPDSGSVDWAWLDFWATRMEAGAEVHYFGTSVTAGEVAGTNTLGEGLNGLVFRGEDLNLDGDVNDPAEVTLFYDGSWTSAPLRELELQGFDVAPDGVYVADGSLGPVALHRFDDRDGDGLASALNEVDLDLWSETAYGAPALTPPFENTGFVFVRELGVSMAGSWADPSPSSMPVITGTGCPLPSSGVTPSISSSGNLVVGEAQFMIQVADTTPGLPVFAAIGLSADLYLGALPLPLELSQFAPTLYEPGCQLYQSADVLLPAFLASGGVDSVSFPLQDDPALVGLVLHFQWFELDVFSNFRLAVSALLSATILP